MEKTTHIAALASLANTLNKFNGSRRNSETPLSVLASLLGLPVESHKFIRALTWIIAFYNEGVNTIQDSSLSESNKSAALNNIRTLFQPFLPPFAAQMQPWYASAMSQTNQSYFDLLSDALKDRYAIYVPDQETLSSLIARLSGLLVELKDQGLPKWINDDFEEAMSLTLTTIEKLPFLAHKVIQSAHASILARLFSVANPEHKRFMVKVATTINIVLAAFIMPAEAVDAGRSYYGWMSESAADQKQIDQYAQPLALPPPTVEAE